MSEQALTNTGLNLPENYTEEQFFEAGRFLANIEHGMQWAIGDWYNAIPWNDKKAACEEVGLNPQTASDYSRVARCFDHTTRVTRLTFNHHRQLVVVQEGTRRGIETESQYLLTPEQRQDLLRQAEQHGWSSVRLKKERDHVLGRMPAEAPPSIQGDMDQVLAELPKTVTKKTRNHIRKILDHMKRDFHAEVAKVVQQERIRLSEKEKEAEERYQRFLDLNKTLPGLMSQEEFRLIRGCLHPDRAPEGRRDQFARAFDIFIRLERSVGQKVA